MEHVERCAAVHMGAQDGEGSLVAVFSDGAARGNSDQQRGIAGWPRTADPRPYAGALW